MSFLDKLNSLMDKKHINKAILAKESGIPYTTIDGFYKKGTDNIKLSTLRKLADYFDCSLDYLVDEAQRNSKENFDMDFSSMNTILARNGKKLTAEEKNELIKILLSDD